MRIGLLSARYPCGTSSEAFLEAELRALASEFGEIIVFPTAVSSQLRDVPDNIHVRLITLVGARTLALAVLELVRRPLAMCTLWQLLRAAGPLSTHIKDIALFPKALCVARDVRRYEIKHLHAYWLSAPASLAYMASKLAGIPYSVTGHRWDIYAPLCQDLKARNACFVRTISRRGAHDLCRRIDEEAASRVVVVHLGVRIPVKPAVRRAGHLLRIVVPAGLVSVKDHATLLAALCQLRQRNIAFHCTLAGIGPLRADCEHRAKQLGIEGQVQFAGQVEHETLLASYVNDRFDVCVLPSREARGGLMEGIPVSLMEAMAAGIPCVATRSGSIPELIDGECGILVSQQNPDELAVALEMLARNPEHARRLADAGRRKVSEHFCVDRNVRKLADLIRGQSA